MMRLLRCIIIVLICLVNEEVVVSVCEDSYMVKCETIDDVLYLEERHSVTELLIQQKNKCNDFSVEYSLKPKHLDELREIQRLIIVQQLRTISSKSFSRKFQLKYVTLYGNHVDAIRKYTFVGLTKLEEVNLRNNALKNIQNYAFTRAKIKTVDLSHNRITILRSHSFYYCTVGKLAIRYNQLATLQSDSLPNGLKFLYLDHNKLKEFSMIHQKNSSQIEELTLSHNDITGIEGFAVLKSLQLLDLSFNKIISVGEEFFDLKELLRLDLSNNNLVEFSFVAFINSNSKRFFLDNNNILRKDFGKLGLTPCNRDSSVFLANNKLRRLDVKSIRSLPVELSLRGNPWNCKCFYFMLKFLTGSLVCQADCDRELMTSGTAPYCAMANSYEEKCAKNKISENTFLSFRESFSRDDKCARLFSINFLPL